MSTSLQAPVQVYSSRYCGWCSRALALLENKHIRPEVLVVDADRELRRQMEERSGRRTVPQIFIGEHHVGGYDDLRALDAAGKLDALLEQAEAAPAYTQTDDGNR